MDVPGLVPQQQEKLAFFMEVVREPAMRAQQFLQATDWHMEDAIQLYFAGLNEGGQGTVPSSTPVRLSQVSEPPVQPEQCPTEISPSESSKGKVGEVVRPPLPVRRETLYEDIFQNRAEQGVHTSNLYTPVDAFRNFFEEGVQRSQWGVEAKSTSNGGPNDCLAALYRPPFVLIYAGTFEQAKAEAVRQGKWLLINLQSSREFSSYMLNRDTWAHEAVKDTIGTSFIFWQVYDDTEEGRKVSTFYELVKMPTTFVLDPLTGQKMRAWTGMISPEQLLEDLVPYMDISPEGMQAVCVLPKKRAREAVKEATDSSSVSLKRTDTRGLDTIGQEEDLKVQVLCGSSQGEATARNVLRIGSACFPPLPEEPGIDDVQSCRVAFRLPDGRRTQRRFLLSDSLQFLWSFCHKQLNEGEAQRAFGLTHSVPGITATLDYTSNMSILEAKAVKKLET